MSLLEEISLNPFKEMLESDQVSLFKMDFNFIDRLTYILFYVPLVEM